MTGPERCKGESYTPGPGGGWFPCRHPAKRDGFCGVHHPDAVAKRAERTKAKQRVRQVKFEERMARSIRRSDLLKAAELLAASFETGALVVTPATPDDLDTLAQFIAAADRYRKLP